MLLGFFKSRRGGLHSPSPEGSPEPFLFWAPAWVYIRHHLNSSLQPCQYVQILLREIKVNKLEDKLKAPFFADKV